MALEQVWRCDVCSEVAKDGDVSAWRQVTIASLLPPPAPEAIPGQPVAYPQPVSTVTAVCHKPSCLTRWAKEENEATK